MYPREGVLEFWVAHAMSALVMYSSNVGIMLAVGKRRMMSIVMMVGVGDACVCNVMVGVGDACVCNVMVGVGDACVCNVVVGVGDACVCNVVVGVGDACVCLRGQSRTQAIRGWPGLSTDGLGYPRMAWAIHRWPGIRD